MWMVPQILLILPLRDSSSPSGGRTTFLRTQSPLSTIPRNGSRGLRNQGSAIYVTPLLCLLAGVAIRCRPLAATGAVVASDDLEVDT